MLREDLERLFDKIMAARIHYGIWYVYKNNVDRPKYVDVMNKYPWFFPPSISAHFVAMLMALSTIYDDGSNHLSISRLFLKLKEVGSIDKTSIQEIEKRLEKNKSIVGKIMILRNNVFAHLSAKIDPFEAFKKARITMNNCRELIYETADVLNEISQASGNGSRILVESSEFDTRDVLSNLKKFGMEAGSKGDKHMMVLVPDVPG